MAASDADLVNRVLTGDRASFGEPVRRYQGHVHGLAYSMVGNWHDAEDIAQDAFIRAYVQLGDLRDPSRFAPWLRRVAFARCMHFLRDAKKKKHVQLQDAEAELSEKAIREGEAQAKRAEMERMVLSGIARLPEQYRIPLTMFHLDGLDYSRVARFLDISEVAARQRVSRGKKMLRKELVDMIGEVFEEHKLTEAFRKKILEGIPRLRYQDCECTFCGAVANTLQHMGHHAPTWYIVGISGSAFKLYWHRKWCPSNGHLTVVNEQRILDQTFSLLGYEYRYIPTWTEEQKNKDALWRAITGSIDAGVPVLAFGVVGPPENSIITGYDEEGRRLLGRSFFHDAEEYFNVADWLESLWGIILLGKQHDPPPDETIIRKTVRFAVDLAHMPEQEERVIGLEAYKVWASELRRDELFQGDAEALSGRNNVNKSVTLSNLIYCRTQASRFLKWASEHIQGSARSKLDAAARLYQTEVEVLKEAAEWVPYCFDAEERQAFIRNAGRRNRQADLLLKARAIDEQAVAELRAWS